MSHQEQRFCSFPQLTDGLNSYVFANFQIQLTPAAEAIPSTKTVPTFLALYSFGFIYELVLVYDALRLKNTIQVIGLCVCNIGLLIYGAAWLIWAGIRESKQH